MNRPGIKDIQIIPNPIDAKAIFKIEIKVKDIYFTRTIEYMEEIYAGQDIGEL